MARTLLALGEANHGFGGCHVRDTSLNTGTPGKRSADGGGLLIGRALYGVIGLATAAGAATAGGFVLREGGSRSKGQGGQGSGGEGAGERTEVHGVLLKGCQVEVWKLPKWRPPESPAEARALRLGLF